MTDSEKYYDNESLKDNLNIAVKKLPFPGNKLPSKEMLDEICGYLKDKKVVGVHCTHGINRTGYIIVYYLCKQLGYTLDSALKAFNDSRSPHTFEKDYLLCDLK